MGHSWGSSRGSAAAGAGRVGAPQPAVPGEVDDPALAQQLLAAELAPMTEVWQRLLLAHVSDDSGRCRTCTKGGTGLRTTPWPCTLSRLADMARRSHAQQHRTAS